MSSAGDAPYATVLAPVCAGPDAPVLDVPDPGEDAVAAERERIGRDLHDTVGQRLFALRLELDACAASCGDPAVAERLRAAVGTVSRASAELREAINALAFAEHPERGLPASLRRLAREATRSTGITVRLRVSGTPRESRADEALFRVAHEALANVARHSGARTATVSLRYGTVRTTLVVRDDGRGLAVPDGEGPRLHFGLRSMRRRMAELGGGLTVGDSVPCGVRLHAWVPAR